MTYHELFHNVAFLIAVTLVAGYLLQLVVRILIGYILRRAVGRHSHMPEFERRKRANTLDRVFKNFSAIIIFVVVLVVVLAELHVNLPALLTGAGLAGVIFGLAAQNVIKNYLAGIFIILENQYRVGDIITLSELGSMYGTSGVVEDITIRTTKLRDMDGSLHIITNGTATVITNMTYNYASPVIDIGVSYDADINKVEAVINKTGELMQSDPRWHHAIIEPIKFLRVDSFSPSSVALKAIGKVKPGEQWTVAGEYRRLLIAAFKDNGIDIPLPQIVINEPKKHLVSKENRESKVA